jgi:hypothetical protein
MIDGGVSMNYDCHTVHIGGREHRGCTPHVLTNIEVDV